MDSHCTTTIKIAWLGCLATYITKPFQASFDMSDGTRSKECGWNGLYDMYIVSLFFLIAFTYIEYQMLLLWDTPNATLADINHMSLNKTCSTLICITDNVPAICVMNMTYFDLVRTDISCISRDVKTPCYTTILRPLLQCLITIQT
jgi:hypothetical protein